MKRQAGTDKENARHKESKSDVIFFIVFSFSNAEGRHSFFNSIAGLEAVEQIVPYDKSTYRHRGVFIRLKAVLYAPV